MRPLSQPDQTMSGSTGSGTANASSQPPVPVQLPTPMPPRPPPPAIRPAEARLVLDVAHHVVRHGVVGHHVIDLRDRQQEMPVGRRAVVADGDAGVVGDEHAIRVRRIDPDVVIVAARRGDLRALSQLPRRAPPALKLRRARAAGRRSARTARSAASARLEHRRAAVARHREARPTGSTADSRRPATPPSRVVRRALARQVRLVHEFHVSPRSFER